MTPNTPTASVFDTVPGLTAHRAGWQSRCEKYRIYRAYYDGSIYDRYRQELSRLQALGNTSLYTGAKQLYAGTRLLFTPLRRVVRVDVAKVPGQWVLDPNKASNATITRVNDLRKRIDAEVVYQDFLTYAGVAGEAAIVVTGDRTSPVITAHRPDEIVTGTLDGQPFGLVVKPVSDATGRYEYALLITPQAVSEYRDGAQQGSSPNPFGVVTVCFSQYRRGEDGCGEPAFGGVVELLDRVNEIASLTLDVITRNAEPLLVATGVSEVSRQAGDDTLVIANADAKVYTVDPNLPIADTLAFIQDVRQEYKNLLPQLSLDELRSASDLAYETVLTLLMELGDHIVAVRTSVDRTIEQVEKLLLGADVPADYALHRDRAWMTLTESQQLALEAQRVSLETAKQALANPQPAPQTGVRS